MTQEILEEEVTGVYIDAEGNVEVIKPVWQLIPSMLQLT